MKRVSRTPPIPLSLSERSVWREPRGRSQIPPRHTGPNPSPINMVHSKQRVCPSPQTHSPKPPPAPCFSGLAFLTGELFKDDFSISRSRLLLLANPPSAGSAGDAVPSRRHSRRKEGARGRAASGAHPGVGKVTLRSSPVLFSCPSPSPSPRFPFGLHYETHMSQRSSHTTRKRRQKPLKRWSWWRSP